MILKDRDEEFSQCAEQLEEVLHALLEQLHSLAKMVQTEWAALTNKGSRPGSKDLAFLLSTVESLLLKNADYIHGAGVVIEPGELSDQELFIEWLYRPSSGKIAAMKLNFNRQSESFYNYQKMPWFTRPRMTGKACVEGPFVDLYGTELYILAFCVPIFANEHFIGLAAADIAMHEFDQLLTRCLLRMTHEAFIMNGEGRIVATNSENWFVGNMANLCSDAKISKLTPTSIEWSLVELSSLR